MQISLCEWNFDAKIIHLQLFFYNYSSVSPIFLFLNPWIFMLHLVLTFEREREKKCHGLKAFSRAVNRAMRVMFVLKIYIKFVLVQVIQFYPWLRCNFQCAKLPDTSPNGAGILWDRGNIKIRVNFRSISLDKWTCTVFLIHSRIGKSPLESSGWQNWFYQSSISSYCASSFDVSFVNQILQPI